LKNTKEALAFAVLQYALGVGPYVKWGSSASPLTRAVGSAVGNDPFAVTAFNASYTDTGLFGFVSSSPGNVAGLVRFTNFNLSCHSSTLNHFCSYIAHFQLSLLNGLAKYGIS
jgi:ubiquinol-cytochrome c reductase core subunit 2